MARRWGGWARALAFAFALPALLVAVPSRARADGSDEPPGDNERVITIGPQAVVIRDKHGKLRMYDDPSQQAPACGSARACVGQVLGMYGIAAFMAYDDFTVVGLEGVTPPRLESPR